MGVEQTAFYPKDKPNCDSGIVVGGIFPQPKTSTNKKVRDRRSGPEKPSPKECNEVKENHNPNIFGLLDF